LKIKKDFGISKIDENFDCKIYRMNLDLIEIREITINVERICPFTIPGSICICQGQNAIAIHCILYKCTYFQ